MSFAVNKAYGFQRRGSGRFCLNGQLHMRQTIETAPRDGKTVILEDDASGTYDVARWSAKAGGWVSENGEPSKIAPTHWQLRSRDEYFLQENDRSPRRFATLSTTATLLAVGLMGLYLLGLYFQVVRPEIHLASQDPHKTGLALLQLADADRPGVNAGAQSKQAAEAPRAEARQLLETEQRTAVLANGPAEDRRAIDGLNSLLPGEAASSAHLLGPERKNGAAAAQEQAASTEQHRQALDEERARSTALASELATAQREIEAQAARLRKASEEAAQLRQAKAAKGTLSLEQERRKTAALAQEAATARQELTASTTQHRQALDEERARGATLASELATAQREIEAQAERLRQANDETEQLKQAEAAKSAQSLGQERQKAAAIAQEAAAAQVELTASAGQHRQALDEERARSSALASELVTAQRTIETQAVQVRKASDEIKQKQAEAEKTAQSFEQERQRMAILAQEADAARTELTASTEQYRQALDEERARSAALARELAAAQRAVETQAAQLRKANDETEQLKQAEAEKSAQSLEQERQRMAALAQETDAARNELVASTAQHRKALDEERARRAALWSELATAQREIEVQAAQLRRASEEAGQLRQAADSATAELRQSLQKERDRTEATARDFARVTVGVRVTAEPAASIPISNAAQAAEVAAVAQPAPGPQSNPEATRLVARASLLLGQGDIGGARTVLERAAEAGSAQASFMLAETYDPGILSAWGTYGTRGEVTKARELYAKAHAGGIPEAKDRYDSLRQ